MDINQQIKELDGVMKHVSNMGKDVNSAFASIQKVIEANKGNIPPEYMETLNNLSSKTEAELIKLRDSLDKQGNA